MEYIFGTNYNKEILKTKNNTYTNLTGFHEVVHEYPDQTIIDNFFILRKIDSKKDAEGNCYDWYEIDKHYRIIDKTKPIKEKLEQTTINIEDALCEQDNLNEEYRAIIEDALCEIELMIEQLK